MKGIELTEAGRYFYEKASLILEQVNQTMTDIQQYANLSPLRIGALPSAASYYLPEVSAHVTEQTGKKVAISVSDTTDE
ncbi:hypothetical protein MXD63_46385, partial [Frankia sp. Cpl3]|nr:hypothetical protein [Frankia sp. Cpl3]